MKTCLPCMQLVRHGIKLRGDGKNVGETCQNVCNMCKKLCEKCTKAIVETTPSKNLCNKRCVYRIKRCV